MAFLVNDRHSDGGGAGWRLMGALSGISFPSQPVAASKIIKYAIRCMSIEWKRNYGVVWWWNFELNLLKIPLCIFFISSGLCYDLTFLMPSPMSFRAFIWRLSSFSSFSFFARECKNRIYQVLMNSNRFSSQRHFSSFFTKHKSSYELNHSKERNSNQKVNETKYVVQVDETANHEKEYEIKKRFET